MSRTVLMCVDYYHMIILFIFLKETIII